MVLVSTATNACRLGRPEDGASTHPATAGKMLRRIAKPHASNPLPFFIGAGPLECEGVRQSSFYLSNDFILCFSGCPSTSAALSSSIGFPKISV
mmetsp:Transcript_51470/g.166944  ORF Transcript_51470/g.166944 Transcript_51470/m.166944 type:complete len:94 (+) Transcript_51470:441-722(+)